MSTHIEHEVTFDSGVRLNDVEVRNFAEPQLIEALDALVHLAMTDTGGGRTAAELIMSLYNGADYPLDPSALCYLDERYRAHAFKALRLRIEFHREPHEFYVRGSDLFRAIAELWAMHPRSAARAAW